MSSWLSFGASGNYRLSAPVAYFLSFDLLSEELPSGSSAGRRSSSSRSEPALAPVLVPLEVEPALVPLPDLVLVPVPVPELVPEPAPLPPAAPALVPVPVPVPDPAPEPLEPLDWACSDVVKAAARQIAICVILFSIFITPSCSDERDLSGILQIPERQVRWSKNDVDERSHPALRSWLRT